MCARVWSIRKHIQAHMYHIKVKEYHSFAKEALDFQFYSQKGLRHRSTSKWIFFKNSVSLLSIPFSGYQDSTAYEMRLHISLHEGGR